MLPKILLIFYNWKICRPDFVNTISKMTKYQYNDLETKMRTKENANS
jgi:hypothetical protein